MRRIKSRKGIRLFPMMQVMLKLCCVASTDAEAFFKLISTWAC